MAITPETANPNTNEAGSEEEEGGLSDATVQAIEDALDEGRRGDVLDYVDVLHHADAADLIERLPGDKRDTLIDILSDRFDPNVMAELSESVLEGVVEQLGTDQVARVVAGMESDDAVLVIDQLDEEDQKEVLEALPEMDRTLIEEGLSFPEDSAGRLMQREVVAVPAHWNVGQAIDYMRDAANLPNDFFDLFLVDPAHRPIGAIPLSRVMRTQRQVSLNTLMVQEMKLIPADMDQEEVAFLFRQRDLISAPVVDDSGRLVGVITVDDVVDVIHAEHEEDILRLGGVGEDDIFSNIFYTARTRFWWLLVNLFTAILASVVIGFFDATIEQMVALAVLMPIVASMGGNAGTQSLTVAVRAIAMKELTTTNALRVIGKEVLVGVSNGILFAVLIGLVAWVWFDNVGLGVVIGLAMVFNLIIAGLAGSAIPVMLERFHVDPAVSSAVFLTTVTDVVGFLAFLGLAAAVLL